MGYCHTKHDTPSSAALKDTREDQGELLVLTVSTEGDGEGRERCNASKEGAECRLEEDALPEGAMVHGAWGGLDGGMGERPVDGNGWCYKMVDGGSAESESLQSLKGYTQQVSGKTRRIPRQLQWLRRAHGRAECCGRQRERRGRTIRQFRT